MEAASILLGIWAVQAAIGGALSAPILFLGRKRAGLALWELLALIIPFLAWTILMLSPLATGRKSLANLGEPIFIGFAMPLLALICVSVGTKISERVCALGFITFLSIIAVAVFFLVPFLPE